MALRRRTPSVPRGRHSGRDVQWVVVAVLALGTIVLGAVGFERLREEEHWSIWDSLYASLQLFVLESGSVDEPPVPWQLGAARLLAPAVAAWAALLAVLTLFLEQIRQLAVRLLARDHVVVAGLGTKGFRLARHLHEAGERVVAIERDASSPTVAGCRERGIVVLTGDASDPRLLEKAALGRASRLFAVCGDDGENADVAFATRQAAGPGRARLTAYVHLADVDLWRELKAHELEAGEPRRVRVEFFNLADVAARMMLERHPPFPAGAEAPHVVMWGLEEPAESVILHATRLWRAERGSSGEPLRLSILGPGAHAAGAQLLSRHPELDRICEVQPVELPSAADRDAPPATAAYVCARPEAKAIAAGLGLRSSPLVEGIDVVVVVRDEREGIATALRPDGGVVPFGVIGRALTSEAVLLGTNEAIAHAKHAQYVRDERARGVTPEENPSMVPWDELEESLRESNRRFAESIGTKLEQAGLMVVPAPLASAPAEPILAGDEVEELAIAEHERWRGDLREEGWQPTSGPKDARRKLHPALVPWGDLSEEDRDKDREPIRALPEMLTQAGFELRRAAPRESARPGAEPVGR
jgi:hypothetical protein